MPVSSTLNNGKLTIRVTGDFNFSLHQDFRKTYNVDDTINDIIINLQDTTFLDSSALGMMMAMKKSLPDNTTISIQGCSTDIKRIFEIASMSQFFNIE